MTNEQARRAVRILRAQRQLGEERDASMRSLLQRGVDEDAAAVGPAPSGPEEHRALAMRLLEEGERTAAINTVEQAAAHALWSGDAGLAERVLLAHARLKARRDLAECACRAHRRTPR